MEKNKERVELGCHTNMSEMYGINSAEEYIEEAVKRGYKAIGITDINSTQSFIIAQDYINMNGIKDFKVIYGVRAKFVDDKEMNKEGISKKFDIVIFVKEQKGLKNLYNLVSKAYTNTSDNNPVIFKSQLDEYREGLLYGTEGEYGELYSKVYVDGSNEKIEKTAKYYDFIGIEPLYDVKTEKERENRISANKKICEIGEKLGILVIGSSNPKFINKEDSICNEILNCHNNIEPIEKGNGRYLHTTEELINEFSYLGKEKGYEIVVKNTNEIAKECDEINVKYEYDKKECYPTIENADETIREETYNKANEIYKNKVPKEVKERLELELNSIINNKFASIYMLASEVVKKSINDGYLVCARGSVGNSLVAHLLGIVEYNPLDYNLPFEIFAGKDFDFEPDIDLNFAGEYREKIHEYIRDKFGKDKVFYCGTVGTVAEKTAHSMVEKYCEVFEKDLKENEKENIAKKLIGIKRRIGIHPGGLIILPNTKEIVEFTPIENYNLGERTIKKTHLDYHTINCLYKFDVLAHDNSTILHKLQEITGVDPRTIKLDDKETLSLFLHVEDKKNSLRGVPEFGTNEFVMEMLKKVKPRNLNDLICVSGLSHGTSTWRLNAEFLITAKKAKVDEVISNRADLMNYLISKGIERKLAYDITTFIRKGKASKAIWSNLEDEKLLSEWNEYRNIMKEHNVPKWYIRSCEKIEYLFPKSHAIGYTIDAFRIAWYKVHYPEAFYKVYFEVKGITNIDKYNSKSEVKRRIRYLKELQDDAKYQKDGKEYKYREEINELEILLEMYEKGVKKDTEREKDVYDLINSIAIGDYCREIGHKFNTEELAVLIYRNKKMSIDEKIIKYKELIDNYPDMEVIKRINCEHYDSVKDMIRNEIKRLETLKERLLKDEPDVVYTYSEYNKSTQKWDTWQQIEHLRKTFKEIDKDIKEYIAEYNDTLAYEIMKNFLDENNLMITAKYQVINKKRILVNICASNETELDIDNIFLNIPTPFKKGDLLVSWRDTPFREGILPTKEDIFVLDWLCTWKEGINDLLKEGNYDSSDMTGIGYYMYDDNNELVCDHRWEYDSFEYFDGELEGIYRTLKAISSFLKGKIGLDLFVHAYEEFKFENRRSFKDLYSVEGLKLAGCSKTDIINIIKYRKHEIEA